MALVSSSYAATKDKCLTAMKQEQELTPRLGISTLERLAMSSSAQGMASSVEVHTAQLSSLVVSSPYASLPAAHSRPFFTCSFSLKLRNGQVLRVCAPATVRPLELMKVASDTQIQLQRPRAPDQLPFPIIIPQVLILFVESLNPPEF